MGEHLLPAPPQWETACLLASPSASAGETHVQVSGSLGKSVLVPKTALCIYLLQGNYVGLEDDEWAWSGFFALFFQLLSRSQWNFYGPQHPILYNAVIILSLFHALV